MPTATRRTLHDVLKRLSAEELERVEPIKDEDVDRALDAGRAEREQAEEIVRSATAVPRIQFV